MNRRALIGVVIPALLFFLAAPPAARAWGEKGHTIVAKIAELNLSDRAKAGIQQLLDDRSIADPRLASWADLIRHSGPYQHIYPGNAGWHFIDVPFDATQIDDDRDCKNNGCVVAAIERFRKDMVDSSKAVGKRKEALLFVVHFLGDVHQPLHCAQRNNDRGGNSRSVSYLGSHDHHLNLHAVWDTNLVEAALGGLDPVDKAWRLNQQITSQQRQDWSQGIPRDWAWESHQLATRNAYANQDADAGLPGHPPISLNQEYVTANTAVVEEQLKKAGIRLARVLNAAFE
jgi:hypothetical protein